jgi:hypothetical protein
VYGCGRYVGSPTTVGCQMMHVTSFWIGRRRSRRSVASYICTPLRAMSIPRSTSSVSKAEMPGNTSTCRSSSGAARVISVVG